MPIYWNFRQILDVRPDSTSFTCVGTTKQGARCRQSFISNRDLSSAANILNSMDRCKKLKSSYQYLEELASITLCPRVHRQPGYCQVDAMCKRWRVTIAQYERAVMSEALKKMKANDKVFVDEREEEKKYKPPAPFSQTLKPRDTNISISKRVPAVKLALEDPFTRDTNLASASPSASRWMPAQAPKSRQATTDSSSSQSRPAHITTKLKIEKEDKSLNASVPFKSGMPTPEIPETSIEEPRSEKVDEIHLTPTKIASGKSIRRRPATVKSTTFVTMTSEIAPSQNSSSRSGKLGLQETKTSHTTLTTELPPTPDSILVPRPLFGDISESESEPQNLLPACNFASAQSASYPPTTTNQTPSSQQSQTPSTSGLASGFDYKTPLKSYDFESPTELSIAICLPKNASMLQIKPSKEETKESFKPAIPLKTTVSPVETAPITTIDPTQTPRKVKESSFGWAVVTPETVRYKTYLPAAKYNGLITPPDTPTGSPELGIGSLGFGFPGLIVQPLVVRKPVPNEKAAEELVREICSRCGMGGNGACHCERGEESVKSGCFHSLGLRKLKKEIARKMNALRPKISGRAPDTAKS